MKKMSKSKRLTKILIADDCAPMRQMIRLVLSDLPLEFFEAEDGGAAVEAYTRNQPDWMTIDLAMRPTDGLAAVWEIRARDPQARVLIVTDHDTMAFREAAQLAGATGYVLKDDLWKLRDYIDPAPGSPESGSADSGGGSSSKAARGSSANHVSAAELMFGVWSPFSTAS